MSTTTTTPVKPVTVERMPFGRWMKTVVWRHLILLIAVALRIEPIGRSSPISQSASAASSVWRWSTISPMTSDIDSLIAPDWYQYMRLEEVSVMPWVISWATTSSALA